MDIPQRLIVKYGDRLSIEDGAELRPHEWVMLKVILRDMPGEIVVQKESDIQGDKIADIRYNDRFAEMKHTAGLLTTLDGHVRKAIKQAKGMIVFVDITDATYSKTEAVAVIMNRMHRSGLSDTYLMYDGRVQMWIHQDSNGFTIKRLPTVLQ